MDAVCFFFSRRFHEASQQLFHFLLVTVWHIQFSSRFFVFGYCKLPLSRMCLSVLENPPAPPLSARRVSRACLWGVCLCCVKEVPLYSRVGLLAVLQNHPSEVRFHLRFPAADFPPSLLRGRGVCPGLPGGGGPLPTWAFNFGTVLHPEFGFFLEICYDWVLFWKDFD